MNKTNSVPVPEPRKKYNFDSLEVGESIFVEGQATSAKNKFGFPCVAVPTAHQYGARSGKKFVARNQNGGVRIWRTE